MSDGEGAAGDIAEAYLAHHFAYRPVDATFTGERGYDHLLPDASAGAEATERVSAAKLLSRLADLPHDVGAYGRRPGGGRPARPVGSPTSPSAMGGMSAEPGPGISCNELGDGAAGGRLDSRLARAQLAIAIAPGAPSRFANPAWYTGEAAFGIIGLLLPQSEPTGWDAVAARLAAIPDFLADGRARLAGQPVPRGFVQRAEREAAAMAAFLRADVRLHPSWDAAMAPAADAAARAFVSFAEALSELPDHPVACGQPHLEALMREAHGFDFDADEAVRRAEAAFDDLGEELAELAAAVDPERSWREQIEALSGVGPNTAGGVLERYRRLDRTAAAEGAPLVSVADDYRLDYRPLPPWFRDVAQALYFLSYRSPPASNAGEGSVYWVAPPFGDEGAYLRANADATVKIVHAVHHGSVGHHTQNAAARAAPSRLARLAGSDCALGLAFLSAGSMVEGWACYVQDMMREAPGFYTPAEGLLLKQMERRNAASVLVDVRLHTGEWSPAQAAAFYRNEAGFAPSRVEAEVTRNAMLPATRLMYWLGVEHIRSLRARWKGDTRAFHDTLIGHGHVPVAWAGQEMTRAGLLG